jgi:hypothetical protein
MTRLAGTVGPSSSSAVDMILTKVTLDDLDYQPKNTKELKVQSYGHPSKQGEVAVPITDFKVLENVIISADYARRFINWSTVFESRKNISPGLLTNPNWKGNWKSMFIVSHLY